MRAAFAPAVRCCLRKRENRADRFAYDHLRNEYQIARGALRFLSAEYFGCRPHEIQLRFGRQGKPEFNLSSEVRFNLAHSRAVALYAFVRGCQEHPHPRVETDSDMMTVGLGGSLEDALRAATSGMSQWLEQDYGLTPSEIAQVLGTSAQFKISEVADRNVGVAAKLSKARHSSLAGSSD
jgi:hypothetical protein